MSPFSKFDACPITNFHTRNPITKQITIAKPANKFDPLELAPFSTVSLDTFVIFLIFSFFSFERFFVISKAAGKGNVESFVKNVQVLIGQGKIDEAIAECDVQQGSVANVVRAGLTKYQEVKKEGFDSEKATETIQKEIEEATSLEMPMLEKNMTIIATLVSIGTLMGLLGTVSGMIKAFSGLAAAGAPDQAALATGISEALINTATGIGTSTLSIIMYNVFTSKIDKLTYSIDEAGFAITQAYRRMKARV